MTFSRAQMIEAYKAGFLDGDTRPVLAGPPKGELISRRGGVYVDSLQDAPPRLPTSFRIDEDPKYELAYQLKLEGLDTTVREHILKSQERELVFAKVLAGFVFRSTSIHLLNHRTGLSVHQSWVEDAIEQLRSSFPELTPEE